MKPWLAGFQIEMPANSKFPSAVIPRARGCRRSAQPRPRLFTPDQILKLLYAADREWRGMILADYFTGARLGNIAWLKWENIDLVERSLTFVQEKTDAKIKVPIHPDLLEYFQSLKIPADRGKPIFPSLCNLPGPGHNGLSMRFKRLIKKADIEDGTASKVRPPHKLIVLSFTQARANLGFGQRRRSSRTSQED